MPCLFATSAHHQGLSSGLCLLDMVRMRLRQKPRQQTLCSRQLAPRRTLCISADVHSESAPTRLSDGPPDMNMEHILTTRAAVPKIFSESRIYRPRKLLEWRAPYASQSWFMMCEMSRHGRRERQLQLAFLVRWCDKAGIRRSSQARDKAKRLPDPWHGRWHVFWIESSRWIGLVYRATLTKGE